MKYVIFILCFLVWGEISAQTDTTFTTIEVQDSMVIVSEVVYQGSRRYISQEVLSLEKAEAWINAVVVASDLRLLQLAEANAKVNSDKVKHEAKLIEVKAKIKDKKDKANAGGNKNK